MANPIIVTSQVSIAAGELKFTFVRSTGPGGQNVNKVNSKAVLDWNVRQSKSLPEDVKERFLGRYARRISRAGRLVLSSDRHREQARNVADCRRKLRELVLRCSLHRSLESEPDPRVGRFSADCNRSEAGPAKQARHFHPRTSEGLPRPRACQRPRWPFGSRLLNETGCFSQ